MLKRITLATALASLILVGSAATCRSATERAAPVSVALAATHAAEPCAGPVAAILQDSRPAIQIAPSKVIATDPGPRPLGSKLPDRATDIDRRRPENLEARGTGYMALLFAGRTRRMTYG